MKNNASFFNSRVIHALTVAALAATTLYLSHPAHAVNLVANGDFETGDLTGWLLTPGGLGTSSFSFVQAGSGVAGSNGYVNGEATDNPSTLSQTIGTTPGAAYTFSFAVKPNDAGVAAGDNSFTATFDGSPVYTFFNSTSGTFGTQSFNVTASSVSSEISFTGFNNNANIALDNVRVDPFVAVAVPEAGTLTLAASGLALGLLGIIRRRQRAAATEVI